MHWKILPDCCWSYDQASTTGGNIMIFWREQMSVGHVLIDQDHRFLVCLLNTIELAMRSGVGVDDIKHLLKELAEYADQHFAREEALMEKAKYPRYEEHKGHHFDLRMQFTQIEAQFSDAYKGEKLDEEASQQLAGLLRNWLINHVLKEDLLMKPMFVGGKLAQSTTAR